MDFTNCNGSEERLWNRCSNLTEYYSECSHADDIGVHCEPGKLVMDCKVHACYNILCTASCSDGQLKEIHNYNMYYQRIEICSNKRWKTLSSRHWSSQNSDVACRQLGYEGIIQ